MRNGTENAMNATEKTPGYNCRLSIAFSSDKRGKKLAYYWSAGSFNRRAAPGTFGRWIKMPLAAAELFVAQGQADCVPYTRMSDSFNENADEARREAACNKAATFTPEQRAATARLIDMLKNTPRKTNTNEMN